MAFPVVDAFLVEPEQGVKGKIAICTNTLAPGMVLNEISFDLRADLSVLGSLVVNRDGAERMILNCLVHPTIEYLILFGQETLSFCPSTNLLSALMDGYRQDKKGNFIVGGKGVSPHYPNISPQLLDLFRKRIKVIPLFDHHQSDVIISRYLEWLKPTVFPPLYESLKCIHNQKKYYYDALAHLISLVSSVAPSTVTQTQLDPKDFQHLQPPIVELSGATPALEVPFLVRREKDNIVVDVDFPQGGITICANDSFLLAYSLMDYMNRHQLFLSALAQLWLGVELSRIEMAIRSDVQLASFVLSRVDGTLPRTSVAAADRTILKADQEYYYKIGLKNGWICVQSLAHDTCSSVFEFRAKTIGPLIERLGSENRFADYEQQFLHRVDVGIESGRAAIALGLGLSYFQDFRSLFKINTTHFPYLFAEGDSFLGVHQKVITRLYTQGLTAPHPDGHKGQMRDGCVLAVYRNSARSLAHFPEVYSAGSQSAKELRDDYKNQLSSPIVQGSYTYGSRTRSHYGVDQLDRTAEFLRNNPTATSVIARFDPVVDMTLKETLVVDAAGKVVRTRLEASKDPCLTHDIYFIIGKKLHSFHIARAHNIVNAYPENIFGLHDAYDSFIAQQLGLELGDLYMLSSRGNILLLNEEQKAKKLIAEPAKPIESLDTTSGPYDLSRTVGCSGVAFCHLPLKESTSPPAYPCLLRLENYEGINQIQKAISYLKKKGDSHNNPILTCYHPHQPLISKEQRLLFFQCNQRGGKLWATAVFIDGNPEHLHQDAELCSYLSTRFRSELNLPLGELYLFFVPWRDAR